jgi:hypothetical protein
MQATRLAGVGAPGPLQPALAAARTPALPRGTPAVDEPALAAAARRAAAPQLPAAGPAARRRACVAGAWRDGDARAAAARCARAPAAPPRMSAHSRSLFFPLLHIPTHCRSC